MLVPEALIIQSDLYIEWIHATITIPCLNGALNSALKLVKTISSSCFEGLRHWKASNFKMQ